MQYQYALVENVRREAFLGGKGLCLVCGANMVAKCGTHIVHHWAHERSRDCDPWWENETEWHRDWKNLFSEDCREIAHTADDGEIHRADVKTHTGIVIEFQHSAITDEERLSREKFYRNLVWVVDGRSFKNNFHILHPLPRPDSELAKDLIWIKGKKGMLGSENGLFHRLSENIGGVVGELVQIHGIGEIQKEVDGEYRGHHQYDWVRPHETWLSATCPVYIDFGDDVLLRLEKYGEIELPCAYYVSKKKFLHDVLVETSVVSVATRFYPIA